MTFRSLLVKDLLVSLLIFGAVGMALGAGTWAYLSDTDASPSNAIDGATLDLKLDGADSLPAVLSIPDAVPGDTVSANVSLTNAGSSNADHVDVEFDYAENASESAEPSDPDLGRELTANETAAHVVVTTLAYEDESGTVLTDILANTSDANGNNVVDLHDLRAKQPVVSGLRAPGTGGASPTYLNVSLRIASDDGSSGFSGTDEDLMADGIDFEIRFTLNQRATQ